MLTIIVVTKAPAMTPTPLPRPQRPGEWLEYNPLLTLVVVGLAGVWLWQEFASKDAILAISNLNTYNLLFLTLGFSLTGYLLPWDQKGYWATKVATNIMGGAPGIGPYLQKTLVDGPDYGNQTVTRFYGLHVGVLPVLLVLCLVAHVALFRRHGITTPEGSENRPVATFWPEQLFMDTVASALVLGVVIFYATFIILLNLVADILYAALNPRVRFAR